MSNIEDYMKDWTDGRIEAFRRTLLDWYDSQSHTHQLPWRAHLDPYYIWVSEIMLQQTQVQTVISYFNRFIDTLPTIKDLANADEETLLSLWQGLGYYSRVRNMHKAAQQIMKDYDGQMPSTYQELVKLPGIGPYTAGAIASIAFGESEPAIDGNLMRVTARMFEIDEDITKAKTKRLFYDILKRLIDPKRPGDFNQAMMDLGRTIMTPANLTPELSPIKEFDQSYQNGTAHLYPVKKKKTKATTHHYIAYVITNSKGQWLMTKHDEGQLLTGLWHFPLVEQQLQMQDATSTELIEPLQETLKDAVEEVDATYQLGTHQMSLFPTNLEAMFPTIKHVFSHRIWYVRLVPIQVQDLTLTETDYQWVDRETIEQYPYSTLQDKLFKAVEGL
ncbi:A/G-specific adenine glycosylase [Dolosicoccus paucivorans]|uniref:Adenine DNA glycosylase n=1 Tax=Dolosicoccus paucivorans TaxID=84521 RepID=A0A2N6SP37_9LACT|nr:A/G-specific adenine glycosylase [Dolosicoccus paucivorans]PMB84842.1 A/G-specific adenine glycosylase [Dolosicoccus paucivorans]PMC58838.1 A/G-specific adenine glycosylase [Dolosicoccus paucivorans]